MKEDKLTRECSSYKRKRNNDHHVVAKKVEGLGDDVARVRAINLKNSIHEGRSTS